jgi:hypothetical protein
LEAIYNVDNKTIIAANARAGSQHLRLISRQLLYKQYFYFDHRFVQRLHTEEYKLVHVVRDPYYRWRSWFYSFTWKNPSLNLNIESWTVDDARNWMKDFDIARHYNTHTGLQQVMFNIYFAEKNFGSHEYIMMNDIDYYCGLTNSTRINYDTHHEKENLIDPEVVNYMKYKIMDLYQSDYNWLKSLQIWNNGVDTLTKRC